jgi:poly-gamma-glutamate system protein
MIRKIPREEYRQMTDAAIQMHNAIQEISAFKDSLHIPQSIINDPVRSGFIGEEYSPITTTLGNLEAKQTSTNPDFAALLVFWLKSLRVNPGETVVIHVSGSFPALGIAAIIACEITELRPIILSSAGASSFGANHPDFTYWDMEYLLWRKGVIKHHTDFATPGGENDNGSSLTSEGNKKLKEAANRNQLTLYIGNSLEESIDRKWQFIQKFKSIAVFINIGGNQAAMGNNNCSLAIPNGLIRTPLNCNEPDKGLIHLLNQKNILVIQFLNIRNIALQNGIALSPITLPKPGQSSLYYIKEKPPWLPIISFVLLLTLLSYLRLKQIK